MATSPFRAGTTPDLLLVEPDNLIRSTVAGVCKQLNLARINQAASISVAQATIESNPVDLMLVSLAEGEAAIRFLEELREGKWGASSAAPIAVTSESAQAALITRIKPLAVKRVLLQPYRIKDVVLTIECLLQALEEA